MFLPYLSFLYPKFPVFYELFVRIVFVTDKLIYYKCRRKKHA